MSSIGYSGLKTLVVFCSLAVIAISAPVQANQPLLDQIGVDLPSVPCLLKVPFAYKHGDSAFQVTKKATCFMIDVICDSNLIQRFFITNNHPFVLDDSAQNVHIETDSGLVLVNMRNSARNRDTVVTGKVGVLARNGPQDLVLLDFSVQVPLGFRMGINCPQIDLDSTFRDPSVAEDIAYVGFPLLLGEDTTFLRGNEPLVIMGSVAQVPKSRPWFIIQAPTFPGASGSPVFSAKDGHFLGVTSAVVRKKNAGDSAYESFQYALKASWIVPWIKSMIRGDVLEKACGTAK